MNKYKVGDKVVYEVKEIIRDGGVYLLSGWKESEPLSTYTEPLERKNENKQKQIEKLVDKLHRQAAEITRLLSENKRLKAENGNVLWNIEQARAEGQNEAWELARKIVLMEKEGGMKDEDYKAIFGGCQPSDYILKTHTYPEAAAKVKAWKKAKEEIKVGDVLEGIYDNEVKCIVTNLCPDNTSYLVFDDGTTGICDLDNFKKTGRHIDIDCFLKQIGGEQE